MSGHDGVPVADQMVWSLAQEVRPGDVAIVGVGTPMATAAALLARELLGTEVTVIVAASVDPPVHDVAVPVVDQGFIARTAVGTYAQTEILDAIQRGRVTLQFVSPAQVDGLGRLNTSRVPGRDGGLRRLPGGLATGDIAVLMGRLVAYRAGHSPRFLAEEVAFVSGTGHEHGPNWRTRHGLPGAGLRTVVTDRAVLRWDDDHHGFALASVHGGATVDEVVAATGFPLLVDDDTSVTEPPSEAALRLLDEVIDPHGTRRLETPDGRDAARAALAALAERPTDPTDLLTVR